MAVEGGGRSIFGDKKSGAALTSGASKYTTLLFSRTGRSGVTRGGDDDGSCCNNALVRLINGVKTLFTTWSFVGNEIGVDIKTGAAADDNARTNRL